MKEQNQNQHQEPKHRERLQKICKGFEEAAQRLTKEQMEGLERGDLQIQLTPTVGKEGGGAGKQQQHRSPFRW